MLLAVNMCINYSCFTIIIVITFPLPVPRQVFDPEEIVFTNTIVGEVLSALVFLKRNIIYTGLHRCTIILSTKFKNNVVNDI